MYTPSGSGEPHDEQAGSVLRRCANARWVCEAHPERPWGNVQSACCCGAPGEPCPVCNRADTDTVPEMQDGLVISVKNEDWDKQLREPAG